MKQWMNKLLQQLELPADDSISTKTNGKANGKGKNSPPEMNEEKATVLYFLDILHKNLFETDKHSPRKVREKIDQLSLQLVSGEETEKVLTEIRHFYSSYRIDEYSYVQNSFDDFKRIIWDFVDQISEDINEEKQNDNKVGQHLNDLKEAVEAQDIEVLRKKSHEFIQAYSQLQTVKKEKRKKRMQSVKKNIDAMKKQLLDAHNETNTDHLTGAYNRKCFDEQIKKYIRMNEVEPMQASLVLLDIDHFKKINDTFGHDVGDFIIKECVNALKKYFNKPNEVVARIGGEEFVVILPHHKAEHAVKRVEEVQKFIRNEKYVQNNDTLSFTVSMGIAELQPNETASDWIKRADLALYQSKNNGRNRFTVADTIAREPHVA